jgi:hypothetical protein
MWNYLVLFASGVPFIHPSSLILVSESLLLVVVIAFSPYLMPRYRFSHCDMKNPEMLSLSNSMTIPTLIALHYA